MDDQSFISSGAKALSEIRKKARDKTRNKDVRKSASYLVQERLRTQTQTFTVTISSEQFEKLKWLANSQNISATSALEKAIETEYYMKQQTSQGKRVLVQSANKSIQEIVFG